MFSTFFPGGYFPPGYFPVMDAPPGPNVVGPAPDIRTLYAAHKDPSFCSGTEFYSSGRGWEVVMTDDESLDFSIDYTDLLQAGETIALSAWSVDGGLSVGVHGVDDDELIATLWLSNGAPGASYQVDGLITTSAGRKYERSFRVRVVERR